jgi:lipopolysaccharide/colanic/teichoic acid biosynthesis glycosyltransferase
MINLKPVLKDDRVNNRFYTESSPGSLEANSITIPIYEEKAFSRPISAYVRFKSIMDRLVALLLTIILFPVLLLISIGIQVDSPGHPIFAQERVGKKGCKFIAYKFRTMYSNNDDSRYKDYIKQYILQDAPYKINKNGEKLFKLVDDPRITRIGAILRKSNLDELPQLINIVKGQMSFIGPRPDVPFSVTLYNDWHRNRLNVTPGITGLWQVSYRKGLSFNNMVQLDLDYIERLSPILDIKIILLTIRTILVGDGS